MDVTRPVAKAKVVVPPLWLIVCFAAKFHVACKTAAKTTKSRAERGIKISSEKAKTRG